MFELALYSRKCVACRMQSAELCNVITLSVHADRVKFWQVSSFVVIINVVDSYRK